MSSAHLSARDIELCFLGCASEAADAHASRCEPCAAELRALRAARDALLERLQPEAYARRLQREQQRIAARRRWLTCVSGGLAIAAGVVALLLRASADEIEPVAWLDSKAVSTNAAPAPALAPQDFLPKGDTTLVVVRKRGAELELLQGVLTVAPGDEIRIRFMCRAGGRVVAGVLTDAGQWLPLVDGDFSPGAHAPDATLRVTREPGSGLVVLGTPEEVAAARAGAPAQVQRARLVWTALEPEPPASIDRALLLERGRHGGDERQKVPLTEMDTFDAPPR